MDGSILTLREKQRTQTRSEIVRSAFDLFGKHGYEDVSVEMIAAATGVSRATFFNYFPQKELILREIAAARVEKLKAILAGLTADRETPSFGRILDLVLKLCEENARLAGRSKKLMLETFFRQASQGLMLNARDEAIGALAEVIERIPRRRKVTAKLAAETLFAVYLATMQEWLMREGAPREWLLDAMRERLQTVLEGVA
jgi:AcrR family transcriptional regulator